MICADHQARANLENKNSELADSVTVTASLLASLDPGMLGFMAKSRNLNLEKVLAELVDLKFFCGFSFAEIAALQKLSERTVQRRWEKARIYLHRSIRADLSL
jgi:hypothetical protein